MKSWQVFLKEKVCCVSQDLGIVEDKQRNPSPGDFVGSIIQCSHYPIAHRQSQWQSSWPCAPQTQTANKVVTLPHLAERNNTSKWPCILSLWRTIYWESVYERGSSPRLLVFTSKGYWQFCAAVGWDHCMEWLENLEEGQTQGCFCAWLLKGY